MFFEDRIPTYPNRKKITFEDDGTVRYAIIEYGDIPLNDGSPMNARTLDSIVPNGAIIMWSGSENNIPDGWALCNGQNGTPDLRGRFVIGANSTYSVGEKGGQTTIDWRHSHDYDGTVEITTNTDRVPWGSGSYYDIPTARHTHNYDGTTEIAGSGSQNILPPYYALCFIMKITQIATTLTKE